MKIFFLGLLFNEQSLLDAQMNSKIGVQMAPHLYQAKLIEGIKKQPDVELTVINIPPIGSFPYNYKKAFVKSYEWEKNTQIGFINISGLKYIIQYKKVLNTVEKAIQKYHDLHFIIYTLHEPYIRAICLMKKKYPFIHVTLIQTDAVPGRNGMYKSKRMVCKGNRLIKYTKQFDDYVILSKHLTKPLEIGNKPYVILECICDNNQRLSKKKDRCDNIFLYSGTTAKIYGICNLIKAFERISNAQLWICGSGDSDKFIHEECGKYSNIKHFGYISQDELSDLRDKCDFLINPRIPIGTYTKYSFPSKTAEYLLSGKPVIMYHLEGIPCEYDEFINYLNETTVDGIIEEIKMILSKDYDSLLQKAISASDYIRKKKNEYSQAKKVIDMIRRNS